MRPVFTRFSTLKLCGAIGLLFPLFCSCIREELQPCPPLQVQLDVQDKNYDNIYAVCRLGLEPLRDEHLPFKDYVSHLYYQLTAVPSGKVVVREELQPVTSDAEVLDLPLPADLPFGKYALTVWGNVADTAQLAHPEKMTLHPEGQSGDDLYLSNDTLVFNESHYAYRFSMKRVKGKLIVLVKDMPESYGYSEKSVDDISEEVDHEFRYSGSQRLRTSTLWERSDSVRTEMLLGPSAHPTSSVFHIQFYEGQDATSGSSMTPEAITLSILPNHLTVLKYIYDPCCDRFTIYVLINDGWEQLHSMDIN